MRVNFNAEEMLFIIIVVVVIITIIVIRIIIIIIIESERAFQLGMPLTRDQVLLFLLQIPLPSIWKKYS